MTVACPDCAQTMEFSGPRPKFCAFCGRLLDDPALIATVPGSRDSPTIAHTPSSRPDRRDNSAPEPPPESVGGYHLKRPLGQGGMGTVYEAEESSFGRKVALKLLAPEITASPEALQRFRQEGRLASTIAHPRCVFVLNADEQDGRPFIVMELMPGSTLHDLVHEDGPLAIDAAVMKIRDVIEGLREAHRLGVIHRDVKPSNCFLEADGRVKVGDFGLSKSLVNESNLTRTGSFLGTPLYASPEQIKGESLDARTDVYSVSATLYFLLAGRPPFQGSDAAATLAKIVSEPLPSLRSIRPEISAELDRIVLKGLERNRDRRWSDMDELATALLPFSPGRLQIGGLGLRFGAFVLDVNLPKLVVLSLNMAASYTRADGDALRSVSENFAVSAALDQAIFLISFLAIEPLTGASPGKWLLGLRVRGQGTTGSNPATILRRNLIFWGIAVIPWAVWALVLERTGRVGGWGWTVLPIRMLGLAAICFPMRQKNGYLGLHDLLSGTRVVGVPRARKRRSGGARRALGRDRNIAPRPVGVLKTVGPYRIRGAIRWEDGRKVLAAEDSSLGREVWIVLRPKASPAPEPSRRELARATRPRWLTGGDQAEGRWDAYIAPSGCPLADLAGPQGLPWRDVRPIFEDLVEELDAACRDGTLPEGLALDQIWVQPDGRAILVDQLGLSREEDRSDATRPVVMVSRAKEFLYRATALALEGGRRRRDAQALNAPIPEHARTMLESLRENGDARDDFQALREQLAVSQDRTVEVTRSLRATHVGAQAALMVLLLLFQFGMVAWLLGQSTRERSWLQVFGKPVILSLKRAHLLGDLAAVVPPILWVAFSFATRGGLTFPLIGLALASRDGQRASRWRCGLRSFLTWVGPAALLVAAIALKAPDEKGGPLSWTPFWLAVTLVATFPLLAMIRPDRGLQDILAGTVVVPK